MEEIDRKRRQTKRARELQKSNDLSKQCDEIFDRLSKECPPSKESDKPSDPKDNDASGESSGDILNDSFLSDILDQEDQIKARVKRKRRYNVEEDE